MRDESTAGEPAALADSATPARALESLATQMVRSMAVTTKSPMTLRRAVSAIVLTILSSPLCALLVRGPRAGTLQLARRAYIGMNTPRI